MSGDAAPFPDHFSARAEGYAAHRPTYPPELAVALAALAPTRELAWDAGCGSGQLSTLLAGPFRRVVATDASAAQIAHAVPAPGVTWRVARAEASGIEAGTVDLAVAAQAAHWFDLEGYWDEVRRVARPGAAVALVAYGLFEVDPAVDAVTRRFHDEVLGWEHWPPARWHVMDGYARLPFPFDPVPTPDLAIRHRWTLERTLRYVDTWSGVAALERAGGRAEVEAFRRRLTGAWGRDDVREVTWPLTVRAGRVAGVSGSRTPSGRRPG